MFTPRGPAVPIGQARSIATTTLHGGVGTGVLLNGNGTSTLTGPNSVPVTVQTPR